LRVAGINGHIRGNIDASLYVIGYDIGAYRIVSTVTHVFPCQKGSLPSDWAPNETKDLSSCITSIMLPQLRHHIILPYTR